VPRVVYSEDHGLDLDAWQRVFAAGGVVTAHQLRGRTTGHYLTLQWCPGRGGMVMDPLEVWLALLGSQLVRLHVLQLCRLAAWKLCTGHCEQLLLCTWLVCLVHVGGVLCCCG
jgi:hypothetical protein